MNPLTWGLAGWWLAQMFVPLVCSDPFSWPRALGMSVGLGIIGMWGGLVLCGLLSNQRSYEAGGCLGFLFAWGALTAANFTAAHWLGVPAFVAGVASFLTAPLGLWLMGRSRMSLLVVGALLFTGTIYVQWAICVDGFSLGRALGGQAFLLAVLVVQVALMRRLRARPAPPSEARPPWLGK